MFGLLRGASCGLKTEERQAWMGHICGVCLALRDQAGHLSRLATNYDAALLSVLCEAQNPAPAARYTSHCPLRSHFKTEITAPDSRAAQYAASVALLMAATKVADHLADDETAWRHLPTLAGRVADRWSAKAQRLAGRLGFNTGQIEGQTGRQGVVEAEPGRDFFYYAQPTELAVGAAFQHTAVIANRPHNGPILYEMGRLFGRIMYLLDSYQDYAADLAGQKFNALAACYPAAAIQARADEIFQSAYRALRRYFHQLELDQPRLAHKLLVQQLGKRSRQVLQMGGCTTCSCRLPAATTVGVDGAEIDQTTPTGGLLDRLISLFSRRRKRRRITGWACCDAIICCDCCTDCCCCCDWDLCECDEGGCEFCECECCECCECSCCGEGCCCDCDCG